MIDFLSLPADTDLAYSWVRAVFPSDADEPYGQAFAVFTSSLTFIAALFMGWHVLIGIITSAYSGKVLGERYHQIWAPLRVVLGFGLLVPIAGGFSSVHYLLRDIVGVAAVQMANAPIVTYINGMASNPPGLSPAAMQGGTVANQVLSLQACSATVKGVNTVNGIWWDPAKSAYSPPAVKWKEIGVDGYKWDFGDCGSLFLMDPKPEGEFAEGSTAKIQQFSATRAEATSKLMKDLEGSGSDGVINFDEFGKYFASKAFDEKMGAAQAKELKDAGYIPANFLSKLTEGAEQWNKSVAEAAKSVFADSSEVLRKNLVERINKYGFMAAGSYERSLSQISAMATTFAGGQPTMIMGSPGYRYDDAWKGGQGAIVAARQLETRRNGMAGAGAALPEDGLSSLDLAGAVMGPMMSNSPMYGEDPSRGRLSGDPVGDMISLGHNTLAGAEAGMLTMLAAHSWGGAAGNSALAWVGIGGGAEAAINYLASWIGYAIMIALIVGIMHAFVLPMIPMIMVFIMGVSWLVLFLEAAIAGVLWAFAFVRMDGQEFFDRNQAPGVTLLFNLFLRPAIGMLAFIGGMILMPYLLNGLILIWDDSFAAQTGSFGWNIFSIAIQWIVGMIMLCWMQWHLYLRVWGLVPTIADRVGHWMGFQMHGYNDGQETHQATQALIAAGVAVTKAPLFPGGGRGGRIPSGGGDIGGGGAGGGGAGGGGGGGAAPGGGGRYSGSKSSVRSIAGNTFDPGKPRGKNR